MKLTQLNKIFIRDTIFDSRCGATVKEAKVSQFLKGDKVKKKLVEYT